MPVKKYPYIKKTRHEVKDKGASTLKGAHDMLSGSNHGTMRVSKEAAEKFHEFALQHGELAAKKVAAIAQQIAFGEKRTTVVPRDVIAAILCKA
jgi:histone H3/H4